MEETLYEVTDGTILIGSHLNLKNALLLVEAYMNTYYEEPSLDVTISRMYNPLNVVEEEEGNE